jgi:hypothetical protein
MGRAQSGLFICHQGYDHESGRERLVPGIEDTGRIGIDSGIILVDAWAAGT